MRCAALCLACAVILTSKVYRLKNTCQRSNLKASSVVEEIVGQV